MTPEERANAIAHCAELERGHPSIHERVRYEALYQIKATIAQARAEAIEDAAKIAVDAAFGETASRKSVCLEIAAAIRALPGAQP